ncbi:MAG: hypothetical protein HY540_01565 [Deltaproteobacteria bacterium]|nr:hypothetical protein [Deltaproteobacteria bacterium]
MVDKVDRIEAPPPYRVNEAREARDQQGQGRQPSQEEEKAEYKRETTSEWGKFHRQEITIQPTKVARQSIDRCYFCAALIRSGNPIVIVNIAWTNGRITEGAHILLSRIDDYFRLRHLRPGQEVPEEIWGETDPVEIGIPKALGGSGAIRMPGSSPEIAPPPMPMEKTPWGLIAAVLFAAAIIAIILFQL